MVARCQQRHDEIFLPLHLIDCDAGSFSFLVADTETDGDRELTHPDFKEHSLC